MVYRCVARCSVLRPQWQPAWVGQPRLQETVERWGRLVGRGRSGRPRTTQGRGAHGLLNGDRDDAPPTSCPAGCGHSAHCWRRAACADADHVAHESQGPAIPATPDLPAEHDEPLGPASRELRVGRLFASFSNAERCPIRVGSARLRLPRARQGRHEGSVAAQRDACPAACGHLPRLRVPRCVPTIVGAPVVPRARLLPKRSIPTPFRLLWPGAPAAQSAGMPARGRRARLCDPRIPARGRTGQR